MPSQPLFRLFIADRRADGARAVWKSYQSIEMRVWLQKRDVFCCMDCLHLEGIIRHGDGSQRDRLGEGTPSAIGG
jgi:hypothetical protein